MNFDFALILFILIVVTGVIWGVDALFFAKRRLQAAGEGLAEGGETPAAAKEPLLVEYARFLFPVVLIVFVLRGFLVEPFRIPSGSMLPTLEIGDFILVNKFAYGVRVPILNAKIVDFGAPERGDVVVFRYPGNPNIDYIKRVVGVAGDEIAYYKKTLYINGKPAPQEYQGTYAVGNGMNVRLLDEALGEISHSILDFPTRPSIDRKWVVPAGHYFVMGDNRDNSNDSRVWGFVPDENLVGKAFFIWMNLSWGDGVSFSWRRIGTVIN